MGDIERICDNCKRDVTPIKDLNISLFRDFRGNGIAFVCNECIPELNELLYKVKGAPARDEDGNNLCSPFGTPAIHSLEQLKEEATK